MKKYTKKIVCLFISLLLAISVCPFITGCGSNENGDKTLLYNDYDTNYDPNIDSWKQIKEDDSDVDITWFCNYSYSVSQNVVDLIYSKTGVRVNFVSASDDRNTELNKWIIDDNLPDIVALGDEATVSQLVQEGYVYKINRLAESYAPSMLKRIPQDMYDYYKDADGDMFALGHSFYTEKDMKEFEEAGGHQLTSYDCLVRKDYLKAYITYRKSLDSSFDENTICKASNFLDMCRWVKQTYSIPNNKPTVEIFNMESTGRYDIYNYTIEALLDFFCVPREDAQGNYINRYDTEEFKEVIKFLNTMYTEHLICSANINYTLSDVQSNVQRGDPFAVIGTGQQVVNHEKTLEIKGYNAQTNTVNDSNQYVSILLTNDKGDAPLVTDYSVKGRYSILVSNKCTRVDRVIKVLDYLISEEGQRDMWYGGEEGVYYNIITRPGEKYPNSEVVSSYGTIEWTDTAKALMNQNNNSNLYAVGIHTQTPLTNQIYKRMTSAETHYSGVTTLSTWIEYRFKCTYFNYTYSQFPFRYPIDRSNRKVLNNYLDSQAEIDNIWIEYLPKIIIAKNNEEALSVYKTALDKVKTKDYNNWLNFRNTNFKAYKEYLGIDYAWPKADPSYVAPNVTLYGSYDEYIFDVPDSVAWM